MTDASFLALSRRRALASALGFGLAIEFVGHKAFAAVDGALARRKLIVVICRGGMDGLSVSPPVGDSNYAGLRGAIAIPGFDKPGGALKLDDTFGLHPSLAAVHRLALKGEARIAPAIATTDRARSHFEAQDVLENGATAAYGTDSGWLNRALAAMGPGKVKAISVGPTAPLILRGGVEAASWSPGPGVGRDPRLPSILADLYAHDPQLSRALASGLSTEAMAKVATADAKSALSQADAMAAPAATMTPAAMTPATMASGGPDMPAMAGQANGGGAALAAAQRQGLGVARNLGATLAGFMIQDGGPQVAAVSIDGFDTHANQGSSQGQLANRLAYLDAALDGISDGMGPAWKDTAMIVVTEFGRTAHVNGTAGTDHGTASTALLLGGALKRGGIVGDWPTLAQGKLFENRDTYPTIDMRGVFKGLLVDQFGVDRRALDTAIFPGSADVAPAGGIIA
ncbi:MAG TPA: DUF1501 domain-containing protein [Caulobacteraceae bacterium]|nr:DUF1501 domain-containing protein [Caulobacteraceae bacterium]